MKRAALLALAIAACGYRPVHDVVGSEKLAVVLATSGVPDAAVSDEVVAGVRDELAKAGALSAGASYPRCEVEVLRADEASEGIGAALDPSGELAPTSRATRVGIVARAWIVRSKDGTRERDTGDVRTLETIAVPGGATPDAKASAFRHSDALKSAGRRLGHRLASRLLGLPAASDD